MFLRIVSEFKLNSDSKTKIFLFFSSYLHSCEEPIIHGNLTCDTIFIQNTGLLKIGSSKFYLFPINFYTSVKRYIYIYIYIVHYPQLKVFADLAIGRCNCSIYFFCCA
jgi:hypothetical protein